MVAIMLLQYEALLAIACMATIIWLYWHLRLIPAIMTAVTFYYTYLIYVFEYDMVLTRAAVIMTCVSLLFINMVAQCLSSCAGRGRKRGYNRSNHAITKASSSNDHHQLHSQVTDLSAQLDAFVTATGNRFDAVDAALERCIQSIRASNSLSGSDS